VKLLPRPKILVKGKSNFILNLKRGGGMPPLFLLPFLLLFSGKSGIIISEKKRNQILEG